MKQQKASNEV